MEAAGFRPGRCCRSLRLRKQSRGTRQTVPPGCGSQASCEAVRSAHQQQTRCTLERRIQWRHPWARRLGTAHCDARFGDVPTKYIIKLIKNKSLCGQDLAERIGLSPATISHHMSSLVSAGFIHVDKQNPRGFNLEAAQVLFWRKKSRKQVTGLSAGDSLSI